MFARLRWALLAVTALCASPLHAQNTQLDMAIDAYLAEDYSRMAVIESHANAGNAEALGVLGQACYYGNGCPKDRARGIALLERSVAGGDRASAHQLGMIYRYGTGVPRDPVTSARWYARAAEMGDRLSADALIRLPREAVIAAGAGRWIGASGGVTSTFDGVGQPKATAKPAAPPAFTGSIYNRTPQQPAAPPPAPAIRTLPPAPAPAPPSRTVARQNDPGVQALADVLFGGGPKTVAPITMRSGTRFPLFADTGLSPLGDAAASCVIAYNRELDRLEALLAQRTAQGFSAAFEADLVAIQMDLARNVLKNPVRNGGFSGKQLEGALLAHALKQNSSPSAGPTAAFCKTHFATLLGELAGGG